jgi:hypothetical protein
MDMGDPVWEVREDFHEKVMIKTFKMEAGELMREKHC